MRLLTSLQRVSSHRRTLLKSTAAAAANTNIPASPRRTLHTSSTRHQEAVPPRASHVTAAPPPVSGIWAKLLNRSAAPRVPLDEVWPDLPEITETGSLPKFKDDAQISTLQNGMKIVSLPSSSFASGAAIFVNAGSRFEVPGISGITHFFTALSTKSTTNRSDFRIVRDLAKAGSAMGVHVERETMVYSVDALKQALPEAMMVMTDVALNPAFIPHEIWAARKEYLELIEGLNAPLARLEENLHAAAYWNNTVGLPLYASPETVSEFTPELLREWHQAIFSPSRMAFVTIGVEHELIKSICERLFADFKPENSLNRSKAEYTGGEVRESRPKEAMTYVALGLESPSWNDEDFVPSSVLATIMGGGGSFSAGGPGKGMYSRLYTNVLNRNEWIDSANAGQSVFTDTGIFFLTGTSAPELSGKMVKVLLGEMKNMAGNVDSKELNRAKNALKANVLSMLERRGDMLEDAGRQVLTYGKRLPISEVLSKLDKVNASDIQRVAKRMLGTPLSFAAVGNLSHLPRFEDIKNSFK